MAGLAEVHGIKMQMLVDYPPAYHAGAAGIAFTDRHAEIHKWLSGELMRLIKEGMLSAFNIPIGNRADLMQDVFWKAESSMRK